MSIRPKSGPDKLGMAQLINCAEHLVITAGFRSTKNREVRNTVLLVGDWSDYNGAPSSFRNCPSPLHPRLHRHFRRLRLPPRDDVALYLLAATA